MTRALRTIAICAAICGTFGYFTAAASSHVIYDYYADIDDGSYSVVPGGSISIVNIDTTKNTRVVVSPPTGPNRLDITQVAGSDYFGSSTIVGLSAGDTVSVRQPAASVSPTETYVIPSPTIDATVGGSTLSGSVPAGLAGVVEGDYRCSLRSPAYSVPAGPFSFGYTKVIPGETFSISVYSPSGDRTAVYRHAPGETPCIEVRGGGRANPPPGGPPPATPYAVSVDHLIEANAQSVRLVLRRGGVVFADASANSSNLNIPFAQRPQPGDIVDVYRPKTAPAPTYSVTIPQISAVFDASADLIAVTAPAAGSETTYACHVYSCSNENFRSRRDLPAGQTVFDFKLSQGSSLPLDIRPDDVVNADWNSADYTLDFEFQAQPGDLVAPVQSFKLPSKLKISALVKALKKGYKIKLKSNEAGMANLKLGKLASVKKSIKAGTTTLKLKFTKSGKKQIKKLAAKGKKAKPLAVSLTSVVTDASGNASTIVKQTKIKP